MILFSWQYLAEHLSHFKLFIELLIFMLFSLSKLTNRNEFKTTKFKFFNVYKIKLEFFFFIDKL